MKHQKPKLLSNYPWRFASQKDKKEKFRKVILFNIYRAGNHGCHKHPTHGSKHYDRKITVNTTKEKWKKPTAIKGVHYGVVKVVTSFVAGNSTASRF
jgi:hypothetical protein|tara:strand:+ start:1123 stop:1413 length:291 start_codon:yes stop_codon:yes gene_type:complete